MGARILGHEHAGPALDSERRKQPGRPRVMAEISKLVVGMAKSNPRWGYTRIRGALSNLGHTVARSTIANILREHGIEPAPERGERTPWRTFLAAHWETVAATEKGGTGLIFGIRL